MRVDVFNKTVGLLNKDHPSSIPEKLEDKSPTTALSEATNVFVDNFGYITSYPSNTSIDSGSWHSLFSHNGVTLGCENGEVKIINYKEEGSIFDRFNTGIFSTSRLSYAAVNDDIYFVSSDCYGRISGGAVAPWVVDPIPRDSNRSYIGPFAGSCIEFHLSRLWIAIDNLLFFSEPLAFGSFDIANSFIMLPGEIKDIASVSSGIYIATSIGLYFMSGLSPEEFSIKKVIDKKCSNGCFSRTLSGLYISKQENDIGVLFVGENDLFYCSSSVSINQLTPNVTMPSISGVAHSFMFKDFIIFTIGNE